MINLYKLNPLAIGSSDEAIEGYIEYDILNPPVELTNAIINDNKVFEAKAYLASTDFKVLPDYDKDATEVIAKRAEAREFIRANEGVTE